ncbi:MAG: metallophosphoesterase [Deltaproteobacteria bacterium]|jgi:uncharacterized protein (TIGR04168 family)|nr:metallophosphoesterase [Deltaproteobacteria bacterium]MBW2530537.1 metallophosphoesterase [Deltaproteobacteria bacterium]
MRIGIVGDVHMDWGAHDERWFSECGYDLLLVVGDLASRLRDGRRVARSLARLPLPVLVIAGNHDGVRLPLLAAEAFHRDRLSDRLCSAMTGRVAQLERALEPVPLGGYSVHRFELDGGPLAVIAARPHSMGGRRLSFRRYLAQRYGVTSLSESAAHLRMLVDTVGDEPLIFLSHNGPTGLGARPHDIWGCDFRPAWGDFGDPDLREAVDYALAQRKRVVAVVAGHMHHAVRGGGVRCWHVERDGVRYVNAARVPRIIGRGRGSRHHHLLLTGDDEVAAVREVWTRPCVCRAPD